MKRSHTALEVTGAKGILGDLISESPETELQLSPSESQVQQEVLLKEIYRPPQPRKFFNPDEIEKLKRSIEQHDFQGTVLVTLLPKEHPERFKGFKYELIYGGSRCRAMEELGKEAIPATIREDLTQEQIHRIRLNENLIRANLNPLEEAEGLLEIMADETHVTTADVERDLNSFSNAKKRNTKVSGEVATRLEKYEQILEFYKKGTLSSFRTQLIRFRSLPNDVMHAVDQGKIDASKALEIGTVKDMSIREQLLRWIAEENPPVKHIREEKRKLLGEKEKGRVKAKKTSLRTKVEQLFIRLSDSKVLENPEPSTKRTIEQIEKLIEELLKG